MKKIGIIMEANPFHNGHKYFIDSIRKENKEACIIAITSTSFSMRGQISLINKFEKTELLLKSGVNIVLELPTPLTIQSADYFSLNAVTILNKLGVDEIICGCETDNNEIIDRFYNLIKTDEFKNEFKNNLQYHYSYKVTYNLTLSKLNLPDDLVEVFNKPNFSLAFQYYSTIKSLNLPINLKLVKRNDNIKYSSASQLREMCTNDTNIEKYLPYKESIINLNKSNIELNNLIRYNLTIDQNRHHLDKEVINYVLKDIDNIQPNKSFSISRINRALLIELLKINKYYHGIEYVRVLGLDDLGKYILSTLDKDTKKIIFSKPKDDYSTDIKEILNIELTSTKVYDIITGQNNYSNEFNLPIIGEKIK